MGKYNKRTYMQFAEFSQLFEIRAVCLIDVTKHAERRGFIQHKVLHFLKYFVKASSKSFVLELCLDKLLAEFYGVLITNKYFHMLIEKRNGGIVDRRKV